MSDPVDVARVAGRSADLFSAAYQIGGNPAPDRQAMQAQIMDAFGVKPWLVGLAPVPWPTRVWHQVTFARWRGRRMIAREARASGDLP